MSKRKGRSKTSASKTKAKTVVAKSKKPRSVSSKSRVKKSASKMEAPEIRWGHQTWPMEKDVLFRPDRFKYVRKLIHPEGCVFCAASKGEVSFDTLCVHQSKHAMVVLNKFPYNSGHLLVLPKRHCGDMLKLSKDEYADVMALVRVAMRGLNEIYQPGGINMGLNHGAVAGAGMPDHLHFHLIPRWAGDLNFFPLISETKVVIEGLDQTWERMRAWFESQAGGHE